MPAVSVKRFSRGNFEKIEPDNTQIEETQNEETEHELYEESYVIPLRIPIRERAANIASTICVASIVLK